MAFLPDIMPTIVATPLVSPLTLSIWWLGAEAGKTELLGGNIATDFECHLRRNAILLRIAAPYSFGVFAQPRDI